MTRSKPIDAFIELFGATTQSSTSLLPGRSGAPRQADATVIETAPAGAIAELSVLVQSLAQQTKAVGDNTAALGQATQSVDSMGANLLSFARQALSSVSSGGGFLGLSPIVSLIGGLFRRARTPEAQPELPKFNMPDPLSWNLVTSPSSSPAVQTVTYADTGVPKAPAVNNQVTVQIQAMDARSFLERSSEIAGALRSAMLHSSSVNDVMAEME